MSGASDHLSNEVAISAKLTENGVAVGTKSRAVSAADRLLGALVDIGAAYAEGVADKKRLRDQIVRDRLKLEAELAAGYLSELPEIAKALAIESLRETARKQTNAAGIVLDAIEELKQLPPPPPSEPAETVEEQLQSIDEDWIVRFRRFAEEASSDDLQKIWGRVLAGEIQRPGAFSLEALRFVSELDEITAANCQFAVDRSVGTFIPRMKEWDGGDPFNVGMDLERLGIFKGADALPPQQSYTVDANGVLILKNFQRGLAILAEPGHVIKLDSIILSRLGRDIFSLLKPVDPDLGLRNFAELTKNVGAKSAILGSFFITSEGKEAVKHEEVLWDNS